MEATTSNISLSTLQNALAGRYRFERELGRGGMATVYLARDLTHDRPVAVKVLLPELAVTLGQDRFLREIEVGTVLQHPHIVGVLDSGQADGVLYYVMPFIDGASLRDRLDREKQLPVDDTIKITQQVADALAYAHSKGVIHRDIKPENILLTGGNAMVADFGIARAVSVAGGETLTRTGMAVGTPTYMSPEQAMGSKDVTPESDIYSLACVVYEMLVGQPPFTGPTAMALLARHSLDNVPSLKIVRNTVPDAVEDAILRAMAKVPADRFHSATDFANALTDDVGAAQRRQNSLRAKAIAAETMEVKALGGGSRKKTAMIAAAVAVPLIAAGAYFGLAGGSAPQTDAGLEGDFAKKNIAVMYFEDRSPKKELGYLADGLTEALIDELSAVKELKVASRNGSAAFKGKPEIQTDSIARVLKVGTVVNGVVEPAGEGRVRVTVRLNDALENEQIDKKVIEHGAENTLALQDSVAQLVSEFLRKRVGEEVVALTSKTGTRNPAAWDALQRARQKVIEVDALTAARNVPAALQKTAEADAALEAVEKLDGNYIAPIVERGWLAYGAARLVGSGPEYVKWIDAGLGHADRAIQKSPNDLAGIELRGTLHYLQWLTNLAPNPAAAATLLESAQKDLDAATAGTQPARAYNFLSHLLINKQKLNEAKLAAENAYNSDPFLTNVDATIRRLFLASLDLQNREEAEKWCNLHRARFPDSYRSTECKLWLYALPAQQKPNMPEVWATYEEYVRKSPPNVQVFDSLKGRMLVGLAYVRAGKADSAQALARTSEGDPSVDPRRETTNLASIIYAQTGNLDKAYDLQVKWLAANPQQRAFIAQDEAWWLKDLREDPRYKKLVGIAN